MASAPDGNRTVSDQSQKVLVSVSVDRTRFAEVVEAVRRTGLLHDMREMPFLYKVGGAVTPEAIATLEAVDGVRKVRKGGTVEATAT